MTNELSNITSFITSFTPGRFTEEVKKTLTTCVVNKVTILLPKKKKVTINKSIQSTVG